MAAPVNNVPTVMPSGKPLRYIQIDTNADMFGAGIGRAIAGTGETISNVAAQLEANSEKLRMEGAKTSANQAYVTAAMAANELEANYLVTPGVDAATGYPDYTERLKTIRQEALDSLTDDDAKQIFDQSFQSTMISTANSGAVHAAREGRQAAVDSSQARIDVIMNDSSTKFADEGLFQSNLQALDSQLMNLGKLQGWGPDQLLAESKKQHSLAWEARITSMAMTDPRGALQLFQRVRDDMSVENRLRVQGSVVATAQNMAIQAAKDGIRTYGGANADVRPGFQSGVISAGGGGRSAEVDQFLIAHAPGKDPSHITNMQPETANRLAALIDAAPPGIRENITIFSGARSLEHQAELYAKSGGSGMVAKPTPNAPHVRGDAADLGWKGGSFKSMPPEAQAWLHQHAGEFGLTFRLGNEPWHIERVGRSPPQGNFVSRIKAAEGGGAGIVSRAGAVGLMQIMPETGRMVAMQLGIPFDPYRLAHDDAYNALIGTTYLNQMLNKYSGNETLAAAAYNAGPGAVDAWIQQFGDPRIGQVSNEAWAAQIPYAETRDYVGKVMGASGPPPSNQPVTAFMPQGDFQAFVEEKRAWARANFPGDTAFENQLIGGMEAEYKDMVASHNAEVAGNYDNLMGLILPIGEQGSYVTQSEFMAALQTNKDLANQWESLDSTKQNTILTQLRRNDKLNDVQDSTSDTVNPQNLGEYDRLMGMWRNDNSTFMKEDIAGNETLTNSQKKQLIDQRNQQPPSEKTATPADIDLSAALRVGGAAIAAAGLESGASASTNQKKEFNTFTGALVRILNEETERKGRKLTEVEMHGIVQNLLMNAVTSHQRTLFGTPLFWFGDPMMATDDKGFVYQNLDAYPGQEFVGAEAAPALVPTVPPDIRQKIIDTYTAKTGKPPTEAAINQIYFSWRKQRAVQ